MLTIPNSVCITEALYSYFHKTISGGTIVWLKFRDEENIGFPYIILSMAVILPIQLRPPRNFRFQNIAQIWQVNFMNAS